MNTKTNTLVGVRAKSKRSQGRACGASESDINSTSLSPAGCALEADFTEVGDGQAELDSEVLPGGHFECHCHFVAKICIRAPIHALASSIPNAAAPTARTILKPSRPRAAGREGHAPTCELDREAVSA